MTKRDIDKLLQLAPPPESPFFGDGDWSRVESLLGTGLPGDYKELMHLYGQGMFVGASYTSGIYVASYLASTSPVKEAEAYSEYFKTIEGHAYDGFPASPGILGFGSYGDEDTVAWYTRDQPDQWPILFHDVESGVHEISGMNLTQLILALLQETSPLSGDVVEMGSMAGPHVFLPKGRK